MRRAVIAFLASAAAFAPPAQRRVARLAAPASADVDEFRAAAGLKAPAAVDNVRFRATLAPSTAGRSLSFDCQKQLWLYRRVPARYTAGDAEVEIVAEGPRAKLEAFETWLKRATSESGGGERGEGGDGAGLTSCGFDDATGDLEGWSSEGVMLAEVEGPGFLGAPTAGADESALPEVAEAAALQQEAAEATALQQEAAAISMIDYDAAASVAASKGVVGTVQQEVRETFVGKSFGVEIMDGDGDLDLSEEELM
eukprot:CAMPEP_0119273388 /NCGR_PEP_ID=MMETSP1329-20130426/10180_1 /TAXON_ID=114041 /ORGANISM="Genus nov. species nov., Strain RCC1024" /LENGTH=253 /DNA_ID=CAMNT_0007273589 /DNA_START=119 /DNA_END=877 /DNA_ORIENTATION=-